VKRSLLALAAASLAASAALADSLADEADFRFRRGAALYRKGQVDEALGEFLASNRLVKNRNVAFNIARCFEQLKLFNEAYRRYVELLGEDLPAPDRASVQSALQRLRPQLALVQVDTEPPGATVYLDRKDLGARGQTPLELALPKGAASVLVELDGHREARSTVEANVGLVARVSLRLERIYGTLHVDAHPADVELRLDRSDAEPLKIDRGHARVLPGHHEVFATAQGFLPHTLAVQVPPDGDARVHIELMPLPPPSGTLVARANVDGALVRIDGKEAGFTPAVIDNVAAGEHLVEIAADGRETYRSKITVQKDEHASLDARLRYQQPRIAAAQKYLTTEQDAPASVTIIESDEIRAFGWTSLAEALRSVRGLYVSSDRDYESLGVRGFSTPGTYNNRVLVLFDGHVTNDVAVGQGFIGHDFSPDLSGVERIEVVRGPGSVTYGSAAFFAVVNVVHRDPQEGKHASAGGYLGTPGENAGFASASASNGDGTFFTIRGSGLLQSGEPVFIEPGGRSPAIARDLDGERVLHADVRARLANDLSLVASFNQRKKTIPTAPFNTIFGQDGTYTRDQRGFIELAYGHTFESGFGLDARAAYDMTRYFGSWQYQGSDGSIQPGNDTNDSDWVSGEVRFRLPEVASNRVFFGTDAQYRFRQKLTSYTPDPDPRFAFTFSKDLSERVVSAYAGDDLRLHKRAQLSAAVRLDHHVDSFGLVLNPRVALLLQPYDDGRTKLLFGRAFRAPTVYERFFNDNGSTQKQAVDLSPERVTTAEIEHTHQLTDEVSITGAGYWSRIDSLIRAQLVEGDAVQFRNERGIVHSAGVEGEVRWRPGRSALFSIWYGFNRSADASGTILANSPQHTGAVRLLYPVVPEVLSFATELSYGSARYTVSDERNPAQLVGEAIFWNVGLSGEYAKWRVRYGAHVFNALDQRPALPAGPEIPFPGHAVPQLGRALRLSLAATF
jgi:outer membrane receptor protein involved in Fe transport